MSGAQLPLEQLADIKIAHPHDQGRKRHAFDMYVDTAGRDIGRYVRDAKNY